MQDILQKTFKESESVPSANFKDLLWQRIERRIKLIIRVRLSFYILIVLSSAVLFYNLLPAIYSEITSSWTASVVALVFSESVDNLLLVWKDVMYMFVESLPVMSLIVVCGIVSVFVLSLRGALNYKRKLFNI